MENEKWKKEFRKLDFIVNDGDIDFDIIESFIASQIQAAANQEIALLKGKLDRLRQAIRDAGLFEPDCDLNNNVAILTPSPKEEIKCLTYVYS